MDEANRPRVRQLFCRPPNNLFSARSREHSTRGRSRLIIAQTGRKVSMISAAVNGEIDHVRRQIRAVSIALPYRSACSPSLAVRTSLPVCSTKFEARARPGSTIESHLHRLLSPVGSRSYRRRSASRVFQSFRSRISPRSPLEFKSISVRFASRDLALNWFVGLKFLRLLHNPRLRANGRQAEKN